ncbi:hypothetical protein ABZP36_014325 [Zizania latifolia]
MDAAARDAKLANKALKKKGDLRHLWVLVELACASSPDHLVAPRLRLRLVAGGCGLLLALQGPAQAVPGAARELLPRSCTLRWWPRGSRWPLHGDVVRIVSSRSKPQLRETLERYKQEHGEAIDEVLDGRRGNQLAAVLKAAQPALLCLTSPEKHFAEV